MAADFTLRDKAWKIFDHIVDEAAPRGEHTNPWGWSPNGNLSYEPDYPILARLLGVPLFLGADSRTGVPALALDVWLSYELRRSGFDPDETWPRASHPRILPKPVSKLLDAVPRQERERLMTRLAGSSAVPGVSSASANILGKNYPKQVDVIITDWATGPELLISTKRMDSSYGKNAANRVEESYGDAKNLRLRHPRAAIGFVLGLRSDILTKQPDTAAWLIDLLGKLAREDDAYHATCLIMFDYADSVAFTVQGNEDPDSAVFEVGVVATGGGTGAPVAQTEVAFALANLPRVGVRNEYVPAGLSPATFLAEMVNHVLDETPVNYHREARMRRDQAAHIGQGGH